MDKDGELLPLMEQSEDQLVFQRPSSPHVEGEVQLFSEPEQTARTNSSFGQARSTLKTYGRMEDTMSANTYFPVRLLPGVRDSVEPTRNTKEVFRNTFSDGLLPELKKKSQTSCTYVPLNLSSEKRHSAARTTTRTERRNPCTQTSDPEINQNFGEDALRRLIDERLRRMLSKDTQNTNFEESGEEECDSVFSWTGSETAVPVQGKDSLSEWRTFIAKVASTLNINCSESEELEEFKSYIAQHLLPPKEPERIEIPLDGSVIRTLKGVDSEWQANNSIRCFKRKDDQKFTVPRDHFERFCIPPNLDESIEEGVMASSNRQSARFSLSNKSADATNSWLKKLDSSARLLLRQISYGSLFSAYIDKVQSQEEKDEAVKAMSQLFLSMADVTSRIIVNSVSARRGLYLKDMSFKNKATESKLLHSTTIGPKLFGGKFFDVLQSSAENLRNARETQHVRSRTYENLKRSRDSSFESCYEGFPSRDFKKRKVETPFQGQKKSTTPSSFSNNQQNQKKRRFFKKSGFPPFHS